MRSLVLGVLCSVLSALACVDVATAGANDDALARLLIKKGILTQQEYDALKQEIDGVAAPIATPAAITSPVPVAAPPSGMPGPEIAVAELVDRLRDEVREELRRRDRESIAVGARLDTETRFRSRRDVGDRSRGSSSEVYVRAAEVDVAARPLEWVEASLVLKSEYFGADVTNQGQPADGTPALDEAMVTLKSTTFPLYAAMGKRPQPFGAFLGTERWATDPMTKDAYEVNQPGLTLGAFKKFHDTGLELDLSGTAYREEEQLDHFFESGLFDADAVVRSTAAGLRRERDQLGSFIAAATVSPNRFLSFGAGYLTEPGDGRRNQTVTGWVSRTWLGRLTTELEFMAALDRERYVRQLALDDGTVTSERLPRSFEEKVLAAGITYQPVRPLLLGLRYEHLWDDGLAEAAGIWSVRHRATLAASHSFFERDEISVRVIGEYRFSDVRRSGAALGTAAADQNELFARISVTYK